MCSGPRKPSTPPLQQQQQGSGKEATAMAMAAVVLELAAADDVAAVRRAVEEEKVSLGAAAMWYGPSATGVARLGLESRTPAMVAALYGSTAVLGYVLSAAPAEAARASETDGATPLHMAAADWGSPDGKLDWGVQADELHKFRKSASFAFRGQSTMPVTTQATPTAEPDVSWVNSLVKDGHAGDIFAQWSEQEQMVA
uniref:Uncharacterized protein n=1 Tax=Oryza brachyantha TaxID=4533 RepID=J3M3M7_ORYBR